MASRPNREEYDGISCRPTTTAPGPEDAGRLLRLHCSLDALLDRSEKHLRTFAWRAVGLTDKVASRAALGGYYRYVPVVRNWRTPASVVAPIFIVGAPRSGTTILAKVLGHQGDVLLLSEARPVWNRAIPELDQTRFRWEDGELWGRIYLDESDASEQTKTVLEQAFGRLMTQAGKRRLMEKMPVNLFRVRWLRAMWPDAKFIQIIRDPITTAASNVHCWPTIDERQIPQIAIERRLWGKVFPQLAEMLSAIHTPDEWHLFEWRAYVEEGERLKTMFPESYCFLLLEDAQRSPRETLGTVCEFAGLRFTKRLRRAYLTMLDPQIRMATLQIDRDRCAEILGTSAERWGYDF